MHHNYRILIIEKLFVDHDLKPNVIITFQINIILIWINFYLQLHLIDVIFISYYFTYFIFIQNCLISRIFVLLLI